VLGQIEDARTMPLVEMVIFRNDMPRPSGSDKRKQAFSRREIEQRFSMPMKTTLEIKPLFLQKIELLHYFVGTEVAQKASVRCGRY
jgi:hypothetical protein